MGWEQLAQDRGEEIVRLRAEVERLTTEQGEALVDQRRALCAEHDKDLIELKRVRKVAAEEIDRLTTANRIMCEHYNTISRLLAEERKTVERLTGDLETERLRLAGCGVAAIQNTVASREDRILPESPYWSASYGDVCKAVDREIALREENARLASNISDNENIGQAFLAMIDELEPEAVWDSCPTEVYAKAVSEVERLTEELEAVTRERNGLVEHMLAEGDTLITELNQTVDQRTYERNAALARVTSTLTALIQEHRIVVKETARRHEPDCPVCALIESVRGVRHE